MVGSEEVSPYVRHNLTFCSKLLLPFISLRFKTFFWGTFATDFIHTHNTII